MHCLAALALDCCALGLAGAPEFFAQVFRLEDFTEILRLGLPTQLAAKGRLLCQGMWATCGIDSFSPVNCAGGCDIMGVCSVSPDLYIRVVDWSWARGLTHRGDCGSGSNKVGRCERHV